MKKILTSVICVGLAAATLVSCSSKKYNPDADKSKTPVNMPAAVDTLVEAPSDEEEIFEVDTIYAETGTTLKIKKYNGEAEELVIPSELEHKTEGLLPVTEIGDAAFLGNETLKSVVVPEGVTALGLGAFQNCSVLTKVTLPESLVTIGQNAFYNSAIEEINIPASVKTIGYHAFSSQFNPTPWYASLTDEKVIVGDGILLKYNNVNGAAEADISGVKQIAYDAFSNPGDLGVIVSDSLKTIDKNAVFIPAATESGFRFLVPYDSFGEEAVEASGYKYEIVGAPEPMGNPFVWEIDDASDLDSWYGSSVEVSYSADGSMHGVVTLNEEGKADALFSCEDKLNMPADMFKTMKFRMKHNLATVLTSENKANAYMQIYFDDGAGLGEGKSAKLNIEQTSNGVYEEYTVDFSTVESWSGIIKKFRIDTPNHMEGEFWIDSVEFVPVNEDMVYDDLLKPIVKYVPGPEDPFYFKFAEEELAAEWPTSGIDYSYDAESETIHGFVKAEEESVIVSPELNANCVEFRNLIVRMRHNFDVEKTEANADDFNIKIFVDTGAGFPAETHHVLPIEQTSNDEKVEYEFLLCDENGNWYENVKAIKIVPCSNMGGEFWIDKIEIEREDKITKAEFISMLYEAEGKPAVTSESLFRDVVVYDSYCSAVVWATENGLFEVESRYFKPDDKITAGEYVNILNAYIAYKGLEGSVEAPADAAAPVYEMDAETKINVLLGIEEEPEVVEVKFVDKDPALTWTFTDVSEVEEWSGSCVEKALAENLLYGKIVPNADGGYDPILGAPAVSINTDEYKTLKIKMKFVSADENANEANATLQVYFNNGSGLSEASSVRTNIDLSKSGEMVEYVLDMGANEAWTGTVSFFRIDPSNNITGEFWVESIAFEKVAAE